MKLKYLFILITITLISGCSGTFEFQENEFENEIEYSADIELDGEQYQGEVKIEKDSIEIETNNNDIEIEVNDKEENLEFPSSIDKFEFVEQRDDKECSILFDKEFCTSSKFLQYRNPLTKEVVFIHLINVNSGYDNYKGYILNHSKLLGNNIYELEKFEIASFGNSYDIILTQYGKYEENENEGYSFSYSYGNGYGNSVITWYLSKFSSGFKLEVEQISYNDISVERLDGKVAYIKSSQKESNVEIKVETCDSIKNIYLYEGINEIYSNNCEIIEGNLYEVTVITESGVYTELEIAKTSSKEGEVEEPIKTQGFDLEIKEVYLENISQHLFMTNVCVHGDLSIIDLKNKYGWRGTIPSKYIIDYDNQIYIGNNDVTGSIEYIKNGECMVYGWTIQEDLKQYFDKSREITVYLDHENELIENIEYNNKKTLYIEEETTTPNNQEETTLSCYDSDGGRVGDVKGNTYGNDYYTESKIVNYTDKCWIIGNENKGLSEYQCSGNKVFVQHADCEYWLGTPGTCSEGVCIAYNKDNVKKIDYTYNLMLNRDATNNELDKYNNLIGENEEQTYNLLNNIYIIEEYQKKINELTNEEYVNLMYNDLFKRDADQEGLEFWTMVMQNGTPKADIFKIFIETEEFHNTNFILFN